MKIIIRILIPTLFIFTLAGYGWTKELYVNGGTGSDATTYANNDSDNPWATIGRAAWGSTDRNSPSSSEAAQAGDTVNVAPGTYTVSGLSNWETTSKFEVVYNPVNEGSSGNPITFKAEYPASTNESNLTILQTEPGDATDSTGQPVIGSYGKDYIVWDGFYIDEDDCDAHSDTGPVVIWGSGGHGDYVTIKNCKIIASSITTWFNHNNIRMEYVDYTTIENNYLYIDGSAGSDNNACVMIYHGTGHIIRNNECTGSSIASGVFIKGYLPSITDVVVSKNLIYGLNKGIKLLGVVGADVYQNVVRDCTNGVHFHIYNEGGDPHPHPLSCNVVNNTIDNCSSRSVYIQGPSNYDSYDADHVIQNNIVTDSGNYVYSDGTAAYLSVVADWVIDYNMYYTFVDFTNVDATFANWQSSTSQDSNGASTDPRYIDSSSNDFRLCVDDSGSCPGASTAIDFGIDILDLDNDSSTTDPITIGAYITNNEIIGIDNEESVVSLRGIIGIGVILQ
jgi:hypothetical protein